MPLPSSLPSAAQTGSLLAATALAAAGLNLGVLGLANDEVASAGAVQESAEENQSEVQGVQSAQLTATETAVTAGNGTPETAHQVAGTVGGPELKSDGSAPQTTTQTTQTTIQATQTTQASSTTKAPETTLDLTPTSSSSLSSNPPTTEPAEANDPDDQDRATTVAAVTEYLTYEFEGVATVIVAVHDGSRLEFWSATPDPGWVFRVDDNEASKVKIKFRPVDGGDEAEWELKFDDGRLKLKQEY